LWLVVFFLLPIVILVAYSAGAVSLLPTDLLGGLKLWRRFLTEPGGIVL
jgi:ABC-type spermidine/putrescine transport system permease subunit I